MSEESPRPTTETASNTDIGAVIPDLLKITLEDRGLGAGVTLGNGWQPIRRRGHSEVDFAAKVGRCRVLTRLVSRDLRSDARRWLKSQPDLLRCQPWQTHPELEIDK